MDQAAVYQQLTGIFRELFDDDSIVLTPETTSDDIADWDSMNHVSLIVAAESRFGIKFQTAEIEELKNVGDFVSLILKKISARQK